MAFSLRTAATLPLSAALAAGAASPALAGGFKLSEYSVLDLGMAGSGYAALAEGPETIWANPAGLTALDGLQIQAGAHGVIGRGEFNDAGSLDALGAPLTGAEEDDLFNDALIPNLYLSRALNDTVTVGLGVNAPFGLATEYRPDSLTRFQAVKSRLQVLDFNPSIGVAVNDELSVGFGLSAQYADASLSNAIDFRAVCLSQASPTQCAASGLAPGPAEGFSRVAGDDWSFGWNAGVLWEPEPGTRVGLSHRSEISHELEGAVEYGKPAGAALFAPVFNDVSASAPLDLPAETALSLRHQATDRLALNASLVWTWWDLDALVVDYDNPAQPQTRDRLGYDHAARVSIGAEYDWRPDWTLRAGLAFDESPTPDDERTPRAPDSDRVIASIGASWSPNETVQVDAGWQHLFFDDAEVDRTGAGGDRLVGQFDNAADIVGVSVTWRR